MLARRAVEKSFFMPQARPSAPPPPSCSWRIASPRVWRLARSRSIGGKGPLAPPPPPVPHSRPFWLRRPAALNLLMPSLADAAAGWLTKGGHMPILTICPSSLSPAVTRPPRRIGRGRLPLWEVANVACPPAIRVSEMFSSRQMAPLSDLLDIISRVN
ncbi:hypothetical protein B0T11DRAFT_11763 [Plectosphaerella cucumerina]|uniref:Uncharacterized protein n=1 Tax=Plectosphaerella cucumerina TaxID=40658 RepID=A0A8K0X891_9PEZI|nr:hypothetical protein B0T11DRAFT_11763 [Plectosphaerella cucumerina]